MDFISAGLLPEEVSQSSLLLPGTALAGSQKQSYLSLVNGMQGHKHIWQNAVLAGINSLVSPQSAAGALPLADKFTGNCKNGL